MSDQRQLTIHSLASGSSGNSVLVTDGRTHFLIDAGIGIRRLSASMAELSLPIHKLAGIFITHEHTDHTVGAIRVAKRYSVPIIANAATLEVMFRKMSAPSRVMEPGEEITLGDMLIRSFETSHDAVRPVGYSIECGGQRVCYATDTGYITPGVAREAKDADLVVLESNHDVRMLKEGPYPAVIKHRILSDYGHLSNEVAADFLYKLASNERQVTFWLAHLSAVNNTPRLAIDEAKRRLMPFLGKTAGLFVAERDRRSITWQGKPKALQLALSFS